MAEPRAASEATASGVREDPRAGGLGDPPGTRTRTETAPGKTAPGAIAGGAWSSWRERCPPGYRRDAVPADDPARRGVAAAVAPAPRYVPSRDDAKRARTDANANANADANANANADADADANPDAHRADPDADPSTSAGYGVAVAASEEWARALLDAAETRAARRKRRGSSRRDDPRPASRDDPARPPPSPAASPASSRAAVRAAARAVLADPVALAALARRHLACPVARLDDDDDDHRADPTASLRGPDPELFFPPARRVHEDAETETETEAEIEAAASEKTNERAGSSGARLIATPLPAPTAVVGYQRDWLRVASPALALWDKAPFEPLGGRTRDREYVVAAPRALADAAAETAAETSAAYEILGLGSHDPAATIAAAANPARRGDVRAAVFEGETLDDAVDAAAKAIADRRRRGVGEVVVYLATDSDDADATLAAELSAEARIAAIVGARAARDVRATAIPRRALGRASMRPEHARGLAFAAYARAAAEPTNDVDEDEVEVEAKEATRGRARVVAADVTGASRRARPVRWCSDWGGAGQGADDRGASAAAADDDDDDDDDHDSDGDADSGGWRLPAHAPLCALYWRQDDAPRAEESRAPPPPLPAPVPNRLARGLGRASSFAVASNVSASASAAVSLSLSRGGSPAPASPGGPAVVTGHPSRASRLAPPPPATTREEKDAEDAARRRERTAPGLHCCYAVSERSRGARRWVAAAWTDTRGEAFGMEARAFPFPSDGDGDDATFERRVARWLTRRCALFGEALARAAGGGGGGGGDDGDDGAGAGRKGTTSDAAGASSDEAAAARRVARARAFFGDDPFSSAKRTVANGVPDPAADPAAPDPEYRRVAVLRLGAASSAASRALEEAARAVVDAGRLAEVVVGEMHAGTNLRLSPAAEDAAIPGETFAVVSDAVEGVAAAARAPSRRHLGESRGDAAAVAAVTVRVVAICGPGRETRDGDATEHAKKTPRTDAAVDLARRYARLSALAEATTRPRSTRAPPTPPHADAAASLADALARVERFAADEETIDERRTAADGERG